MREKETRQFRNELKYICTEAELEILRVRLDSVMEPDPHADAEGWYTIRSIYFDDPFDTCMRENEDGTTPREKWRIRAYNMDSSRISLECKRKERGMISKTAAILSETQLQTILSGENLPIDASNSPVLNRFLEIRESRGMEPKVIVEYRRKPYVHALGNVRVTLDYDIRSCDDIGRFFDKELPGRPVLPVAQQLLEVKYDAYIPDYIYQSVQMTSMRQTAFSKYYLCRKFAMGGQR